MEEMNIHIQFFGSFKKFGSGLFVSINQKSKVCDLRNLLQIEIQKKYPTTEINHLKDELARSRFATEEKLLAETQELMDGIKIAIIPPVSGG